MGKDVALKTLRTLISNIKIRYYVNRQPYNNIEIGMGKDYMEIFALTCSYGCLYS